MAGLLLCRLQQLSVVNGRTIIDREEECGKGHCPARLRRIIRPRISLLIARPPLIWKINKIKKKRAECGGGSPPTLTSGGSVFLCVCVTQGQWKTKKRKWLSGSCYEGATTDRRDEILSSGGRWWGRMWRWRWWRGCEWTTMYVRKEGMRQILAIPFPKFIHCCHQMEKKITGSSLPPGSNWIPNWLAQMNGRCSHSSELWAIVVLLASGSSIEGILARACAQQTSKNFTLRAWRFD